MSSDPEQSGLELTPWIAILIALVAVLGQTLLLPLLYLVIGMSPAASIGISLLLSFGGAFAMAAPFIPDPPARSLGVSAAPLSAWLAVPLLAPALLLSSELDNVLRVLAATPVVPEPGDVPLSLDAVLLEMFVMPVVNELFYRGLLQPRLAQGWGQHRGVAATALIAGVARVLLNDSLLALGPAVAVALVLGILRQCSGSILPGLLLGVVFGALGVLATEEVFGIPGFDDLGAAHTPLVWLVPSALLVGAGLALCRVSATKLDGPPSRDGGPSRSGQIRD